MNLFLSSTTAAPAGDVIVKVRSAAERVQASALQWRFRYDGRVISPVSFAVGPKCSDAKKKLDCASQKDETRCVLWGSNAAPIPDGDIAEATFRLKQRARSSEAVITLDHSAAASGDGELLAIVPAFSRIAIARTAAPLAKRRPL